MSNHNLIKLKEDNNGGNRYLLAWDAARVVSVGKPVGHYVNEAICHYSDSPATYIEGVRDSVVFNEEVSVVDGVPVYTSTVTAIVPKYRPFVMDQLMKWDKKRFIVVVPDRNGKNVIIGSQDQPCFFSINKRGSKGSFDERNEIEISFTVTRPAPAYNYTPTQALVNTAGLITIGNKVKVA